MKSLTYLLEISINLHSAKPLLICFLSAFLVVFICMPPLIRLIHKFNLFDVPNGRKIHIRPVPTMGGMAVLAGMVASLFIWFPFTGDTFQLCFFLSIIILFALGVMDDLKDLPARYKFIVQLGVSLLITLAGVRITTFNGLFGIHELPLITHYTITVVAIAGITNAFNLIDGADGLAGGLGFMSLVILGVFLLICNDMQAAIIAFALAGGLLAFLYFNFSPARIFMGDTGSLLLGFVIAVLGIRLMQANLSMANPVLPNMPVFVLGTVFIPVFDTIRVFSIRIWNGQSPFTPGKNHIHHLLTGAGISHSSVARLMYFLHGFILLEVFWLRNMKQEFILLFLFAFMCLVLYIFKNIPLLLQKKGFSFLRMFLRTEG
jgi:UDP-GlcNAc:undecaprenyl-phosphate GlcNAc-1-phosphate transferase